MCHASPVPVLSHCYLAGGVTWRWSPASLWAEEVRRGDVAAAGTVEEGDWGQWRRAATVRRRRPAGSSVSPGGGVAWRCPSMLLWAEEARSYVVAATSTMVEGDSVRRRRAVAWSGGGGTHRGGRGGGGQWCGGEGRCGCRRVAPWRRRGIGVGCRTKE